MALKYFDTIDWTENLKVASGSVTHTASDTKTTEKFTAATSPATGVEVGVGNKWLLKVRTPINDTAANALVNVYNVDTFGDTTSTRDVFRDSTTVTNVSATSSFKDKLIEGLFLGSEKKIKIGIAYAVDTSSALTSYYDLYRA